MSKLVNDASARGWDRAVPGAEDLGLVDFSGGAEQGCEKDTYHTPGLEAGIENALASTHAGSPEVEEASATGGIGNAR